MSRCVSVWLWIRDAVNWFGCVKREGTKWRGRETSSKSHSIVFPSNFLVHYHNGLGCSISFVFRPLGRTIKNSNLHAITKLFASHFFRLSNSNERPSLIEIHLRLLCVRCVSFFSPRRTHFCRCGCDVLLACKLYAYSWKFDWTIEHICDMTNDTSTNRILLLIRSHSRCSRHCFVHSFTLLFDSSGTT